MNPLKHLCLANNFRRANHFFLCPKLCLAKKLPDVIDEEICGCVGVCIFISHEASMGWTAYLPANLWINHSWLGKYTIVPRMRHGYSGIDLPPHVFWGSPRSHLKTSLKDVTLVVDDTCFFVGFCRPRYIFWHILFPNSSFELIVGFYMWDPLKV